MRAIILGWFFFIPWTNDDIGPFGTHELCYSVMMWMLDSGIMAERPGGFSPGGTVTCQAK